MKKSLVWLVSPGTRFDAVDSKTTYLACGDRATAVLAASPAAPSRPS
jgi:hypothetical protein